MTAFAETDRNLRLHGDYVRKWRPIQFVQSAPTTATTENAQVAKATGTFRLRILLKRA